MRISPNVNRTDADAKRKPFRRDHYRDGCWWRHSRLKARTHGQEDSAAGTRRLRPARKGKLEFRRRQYRGPVPDQGEVARRARKGIAPANQLLRRGEYQVL